MVQGLWQEAPCRMPLVEPLRARLTAIPWFLSTRLASPSPRLSGCVRAALRRAVCQRCQRPRPQVPRTAFPLVRSAAVCAAADGQKVIQPRNGVHPCIPKKCTDGLILGLSPWEIERKKVQWWPLWRCWPLPARVWFRSVRAPTMRVCDAMRARDVPVWRACGCALALRSTCARRALGEPLSWPVTLTDTPHLKRACQLTAPMCPCSPTLRACGARMVRVSWALGCLIYRKPSEIKGLA